MIVFCEKCNSKFQVDDSKIPEAGIKGRCSVCAHVFLLKRQPAAVEPPVLKNKGADFNSAAAPAQAAVQASSSASTHSTAVPAWELSARTASEDVIFEEAEEVYEVEEVQDSQDFRTVFATDPADSKVTAAHEAFAKFVAQQKNAPEVPGDVRAQVAAYGRTGEESDRLQSHPPLETSTGASACHPEVVADGQWPMRPGGSQKPDRAIMGLLDQQGMTDDYVVQMVQEICRATKYVEGVEKPDWQTRIMGLDMLCKIKGLYAAEKRDDQGNRQVQILTGFNM